MKEGDLVTKTSSQSGSNVYLISEILGDGRVLIKHPISPSILLMSKVEELDQSAPKPPSPTEKCLYFIREKRDLLDYDTKAELEALCAYFSLYNSLSPRQKKTLSKMGGKVASIEFENTTYRAANFVNENQALLDDYNSNWYLNLNDVFSGKKSPTPRQRATIFNIAGFLLAQIGNPKAELQEDGNEG